MLDLFLGQQPKCLIACCPIWKASATEIPAADYLCVCPGLEALSFLVQIEGDFSPLSIPIV